MNKVSKKYLRMSEVYQIFSSSWKHTLDFSEDSLIDMYQYETYGTQIKDKQTNGFYVGKQWMDANIKMWREDLENKLLSKQELYEDKTFPHWWLDKILPL
jgi:hypothetical protein